MYFYITFCQLFLFFSMHINFFLFFHFSQGCFFLYFGAPRYNYCMMDNDTSSHAESHNSR